MSTAEDRREDARDEARLMLHGDPDTPVPEIYVEGPLERISDGTLELAMYGDDLPWWTHTGGNCGGCGQDGCHDGPCTEIPAAGRLLCDRCPNRRAEGWWTP